MDWTNPWRYEEAEDGPHSNGSSDAKDASEGNHDGGHPRGGPSQQQRIQEWRRRVNREVRWLMYRRAAMRYIRRCLP
eukprot:12914477-Prorocentrum_lima.AAC.1